MGKLISGIGLLVIAAFMTLGFFGASFTEISAAVVIAVIIGVVLPGIGGVALIRAYLRQKERLSGRRKSLGRQTLSSEILKFAQRKDGKLTTVEVMSEFAVDQDAAQKALEEFHRRGIAEIELTESGVLVYSFYDIRHLPDKDSSRGVLDA